jgi:hypothetical protein
MFYFYFATSLPLPATCVVQIHLTDGAPIRNRGESTSASSTTITQYSSILPPTFPPCCIVIGDAADHPPMRTLRMQLRPQSTSSDISNSSTDSSNSHHGLTINMTSPGQPPPPSNPVPQDNCSALARHLFSHAKYNTFSSKADVATWCCSNIKAEIIWWLNTIGLMSTAGTRSCRLCAVERLLIGQNFNSTRNKNLLNLKSKLRGICSCKMWFLRFSQSS